MSTRAMIYIKYYDNVLPIFKGVYCVSDGYLSHTGKILKEYYNTTEKVEKLFTGKNIIFHKDGNIEHELQEIEPLIFKSEDDFPKYIDNHYIWDVKEEKWFHSDWDYHNWENLDKLLKDKNIEIKSERVADFYKAISELSKTTSLKINEDNYIKTNDVLNLIENLLK